MNHPVSFAPELYIPNGITDLSFYEKAFGAVEKMRFTNDNGTIHVAEYEIQGAKFHIHEITTRKLFIDPSIIHSTTVCIGLFVPNVDEVISQAINSGATLIDAPQDYDYGYRQGSIRDPFGHIWQIQKKISI
jgi:PhnB protein